MDDTISKIFVKLDTFDLKLDKHQQEEYGRFDTLEGSIKDLRTSFDKVNEQVENPKISKRSLWAAAAGIIIAVTAILGVVMVAIDLWLKP